MFIPEVDPAGVFSNVTSKKHGAEGTLDEPILDAQKDINTSDIEAERLSSTLAVRMTSFRTTAGLPTTYLKGDLSAKNYAMVYNIVYYLS